MLSTLYNLDIHYDSIHRVDNVNIDIILCADPSADPNADPRANYSGSIPRLGLLYRFIGCRRQVVPLLLRPVSDSFGERPLVHIYIYINNITYNSIEFYNTGC